jgi:O-acetyl-ADP-ribose deacetylase (regulator of RNase III)
LAGWGEGDEDAVGNSRNRLLRLADGLNLRSIAFPAI